MEKAHRLVVEMRRARQRIDARVALDGDDRHAHAAEIDAERGADRPEPDDQDFRFLALHFLSL